ncbi:MAG: hypothetical protein KDH96_12395, partial [Candidatus Riesia sp.]|nr:hypothetical protein [Candidatus Riesia sp.]
MVDKRKNILSIGGKYIKGYEDFALSSQELDRITSALVDNDLTEQILSDIRNKGDIMDKNIVRQQEMTDSESSNFRYGLESNNNKFILDDPLLTSFDIEIDGASSPLFTNKPNVNSLSKFLSDYGELYEIGNRIHIHQEFINKIQEIFKISGIGDNNLGDRSYYINKIDGLENFMKDIINYKDDKISLHLYENVSMIIFYIAELYNNLSFSYRNQRYAIPEHLLRFNMSITIKEMRNFVMPTRVKSENPSYDYPFEPSPVSTIRFDLYDCNFNFFDSKIWSEHITQAGLNAGLPVDFSFLTFDIFFKSIRRTLAPDLVPNSYKLDNRSRFSEIDTISAVNLSRLERKEFG